TARVSRRRQRFQKPVKRSTSKGHGRPPEILFDDLILPLKHRRRLPCTSPSRKNPGQLCAKARMTREKGEGDERKSEDDEGDAPTPRKAPLQAAPPRPRRSGSSSPRSACLRS